MNCLSSVATIRGGNTICLFEEKKKEDVRVRVCIIMVLKTNPDN